MQCDGRNYTTIRSLWWDRVQTYFRIASLCADNKSPSPELMNVLDESKVRKKCRRRTLHSVRGCCGPAEEFRYVVRMDISQKDIYERRWRETKTPPLKIILSLSVVAARQLYRTCESWCKRYYRDDVADWASSCSVFKHGYRDSFPFRSFLPFGNCLLDCRASKQLHTERVVVTLLKSINDDAKVAYSSSTFSSTAAAAALLCTVPGLWSTRRWRWGKRQGDKAAERNREGAAQL